MMMKLEEKWLHCRVEFLIQIILGKMEVSIFKFVYCFVDHQKKYHDAPVHGCIVQALLKSDLFIIELKTCNVR
jgi:hypothetical protein